MVFIKDYQRPSSVRKTICSGTGLRERRKEDAVDPSSFLVKILFLVSPVIIVYLLLQKYIRQRSDG
jgi:hypothetical protein